MSACVGYDITIWQSQIPTSVECIAFLQEIAKKWAFVLERCPTTGTPHYQCRVKLKFKRTFQAVKNLVAAGTWYGNFSITSGNVHLGQDFNYVIKTDTLIEGPFTSQDDHEPRVLTRQLGEFLKCELYPWQQQILADAQVFDNRYIDIIFDTKGNCGKSIFAEYLHYKRIARMIPPMNDIQDLCAFVLGMPKSKAYLIDMPRGMKKDKLGQFYAGLETFKNGYCYDKRYAPQECFFDRPRIFVFTNTLPQFSLMSLDRWRVFEMKSDFVLSEMDINAPKKYKRKREPVESESCPSVANESSPEPAKDLLARKPTREFVFYADANPPVDL